MNAPYIELFSKVFDLSKQLGYETYDYIPGDSANYPFVFIGEQFSQDKMTKTRTLGETNLIIHVFHFDKERREADQMLATLKQAIAEMKTTEHFFWVTVASTTETMYETTTRGGDNLVHAVLDITLQFQ